MSGTAVVAAIDLHSSASETIAFPETGKSPHAVRDEILRTRESVQRESQRILQVWDATITLPDFHSSAANLARYLALRSHDLSELQPALSALGLSSLGRCEGHVMANLDAVAAALLHICGTIVVPFPDADLWAEGERKLDAQRRVMFGGDKETAAIMVALPIEAATDAAFVESLVVAGMDCARINCAHDDAQAWAAMAGHVRGAASRLGRDCRILMDLPGPKCRVETVVPEKPDRVHVGERFRLAVAAGRAATDGECRRARNRHKPRQAYRDH
jgi:pyruvate kinase